MLFLHNRRLRAGPAGGDIDHLAVAPSGVWVVDAKNYPGAKVDVEASGGRFGRPRMEKLVVRGRDRTSLVVSLTRQQAVVAGVLEDWDVPVRAMFCFVGAELPWLREPVVNGFAVRGISDARKQLRVDGPVDAELRQELWRVLSQAFPPA